MRLSAHQRRFNRVANAVFAAITGAVSGYVCVLADAGPWMSVTMAVIWTAWTAYDMSE